MKIKRIEIQDFGKLHNYTHNFTDGLNILCHENGWGKSTLTVFIKTMFYGNPTSRSKNLDENERKKYTPWNGGAYGGAIEFECKKGRFRIERTFAEKESGDTFRLFDLSSGLESDVFDKTNLGDALFEIDADGFERSLFLSEHSIDSTKDNDSVRAKLSGLIENPDDIGNYDDAQKIIDSKRQIYKLKGGKGRVADLKNTLSEKKRQLIDLRKMQKDEKDALANLQKARTELGNAEKELQDYNKICTENAKKQSAHTVYNQYVTDLAKKEDSQKKIVESFRDGIIPTHEELVENQEKLTKHRSEQLELNHAKLSDTEKAQLEALTAKFPFNIPTSEDWDSADRLDSDLRKADIEIGKLNIPSTSPAVQNLINIGLPNSQTLQNAKEQIDKAEQLKRQEELPKVQPKAKRKIPTVFPLLSLVGGVGLLILAFAMKTVFCGVGGSALVILSILLFLFGKGKMQSQPEEPVEKSEDVLKPIFAMLSRYGVHTNGGNAYAELATLQKYCVDAREYQKSMVAYRQKKEDFDRTRTEILQAIDSFFAKFDFQKPNSYDRLPILLAKLKNDADQLENLRLKEQKLAKNAEKLEKHCKSLQNELGSFFERLLQPVGNKPENLQHQMESLAMQYRQLTNEIVEKKSEFNTFREKNKALLDSPITEIDLNEEQLQERVTAARKNEKTCDEQWTTLANQTEQIPNLMDEISDIETNYNIAFENLEVIEKTAEFLKNAKETLDTKYLDGMQTAFAKHMNNLWKNENLKAKIDSKMALSLRENAITHDFAYASRGTKDLMQFCARLALTDALFTGDEKPFLILDDPFVNFDDDNLKTALMYLEKLSENTQILYLVCHDSRIPQEATQ